MNRYPSDKYKLLTIRELQLLQLDVMKIIHNICVENSIKYYIIAGSLLGAQRHKGFIPWDDDIDIAMLREDYEHFRAVFNDSFDTTKFFLQNIFTDNDFQPSLMRLCIKGTIQDVPSEYHLKNCKNSYIDIFPLDNVPDNPALQVKQQQTLSRINRLIDLKLYHIYNTNNRLTKTIKKIVSLLLRPIPLGYLQKKREREIQRYNTITTNNVASMASKYGYKKQIMPREFYGEPVLVRFEDTEFFAPQLKEKYLTHLYGSKFMELPPVEKRVKPHDVYKIL